MLEEQSLGSQAFYPLDDKRWLVVVADEVGVTVCMRFGQPHAKGSITIETSGTTPYWFWSRNSL